MIKKFTFAALLLFLVSGANAQRFDRGVKSTLFVPKGQWLTGGSISYSDYDLKDNFTFLVLDNMEIGGYTVSASPFLGYFVKDNMAVGARFGYQRTDGAVKNIDISLNEDLTFKIADYAAVQHTYYGTVMMRNYMSLGNSRRFGLFNEVRFTLGGGQGKIKSGLETEERYKRIYQDIFEFQVGVAPGMAAFLTDNVAVEVSVGVLGFKYKKIDQKTQAAANHFADESARLHSKSANFKIDLFSVSLGVAFYLPTLQPSLRSRDKRDTVQPERQEHRAARKADHE